MLAPLLDKMLTWDIPNRFNASEALDFFEILYAQLTPEELAHPLPDPKNRQRRWKTHDRWADLPAGFVKKWESFRIPEPPLATRILRKICERPWPHLAIVSIRRAVRMARNILKFLFA